MKFDAFLDYGLWGALAYLGALTIKIVAISVVMRFFWARAGQATLLAIVMHGLWIDVARVGGLVDGETWQASAISELNLAPPIHRASPRAGPLRQPHGLGRPERPDRGLTIR